MVTKSNEVLKMKIYGYVRVSTRDQNEDRQMIAMREQNVPEKNILLDKQSGKDFDRPKYQLLIKKNEAGRPALHKEHRPTRAKL